METSGSFYKQSLILGKYLSQSRDDVFKKIHLWAIITSFDTGLDTTAAFQKVTYGEDGVREKFCYPAIFGAERCRFEQALEQIALILEHGDSEHWRQEWQQTLQAMNRWLWDSKKKWYGVMHEDGTLDTRIGIDGLFPLAYKLIDRQKACMAESNFQKLLGRYGVHTVAPDEPGFHAGIYWRGPAWSKSCSVAMAAACNYYPALLPRIRNGLVNFLLKHPSVWECMNASTGKIARGDMGLMATPMISSNVGAGEAIGALLRCHGRNVFSINGADYGSKP